MIMIKKEDTTRNWIKRREEKGIYSNLVQELIVEDTVTCREMMRIDFNCLKISGAQTTRNPNWEVYSYF